VIGAAAAKQALWLSFLLAALIALITAASYAELPSYIPMPAPSTSSCAGLSPASAFWRSWLAS